MRSNMYKEDRAWSGHNNNHFLRVMICFVSRVHCIAGVRERRDRTHYALFLITVSQITCLSTNNKQSRITFACKSLIL